MHKQRQTRQKRTSARNSKSGTSHQSPLSSPKSTPHARSAHSISTSTPKPTALTDLKPELPKTSLKQSKRRYFSRPTSPFDVWDSSFHPSSPFQRRPQPTDLFSLLEEPFGRHDGHSEFDPFPSPFPPNPHSSNPSRPRQQQRQGHFDDAFHPSHSLTPQQQMHRERLAAQYYKQQQVHQHARQLHEQRQREKDHLAEQIREYLAQTQQFQPQSAQSQHTQRQHSQHPQQHQQTTARREQQRAQERDELIKQQQREAQAQFNQMAKHERELKEQRGQEEKMGKAAQDASASKSPQQNDLADGSASDSEEYVDQTAELNVKHDQPDPDELLKMVYNHFANRPKFMDQYHAQHTHQPPPTASTNPTSNPSTQSSSPLPSPSNQSPPTPTDSSSQPDAQPIQRKPAVYKIYQDDLSIHPPPRPPTVLINAAESSLFDDDYTTDGEYETDYEKQLHNSKTTGQPLLSIFPQGVRPKRMLLRPHPNPTTQQHIDQKTRPEAKNAASTQSATRIQHDDTKPTHHNDQVVGKGPESTQPLKAKPQPHPSDTRTSPLRSPPQQTQSPKPHPQQQPQRAPSSTHDPTQAPIHAHQTSPSNQHQSSSGPASATLNPPAQPTQPRPSTGDAAKLPKPDTTSLPPTSTSTCPPKRPTHNVHLPPSSHVLTQNPQPVPAQPTPLSSSSPTSPEHQNPISGIFSMSCAPQPRITTHPNSHPPPPPDLLTHSTSIYDTYQPNPSFYRRHLDPSVSVHYNSPKGRKMFQEALTDGTLEPFFPLSEQFTTQLEPAYCGLSTLAMSLNAMSIDPVHKVWKKPWRWYTDDLLACCHPLTEIANGGMTFEQFNNLARCHGVNVEEYYASDVDVNFLRQRIVEYCKAPSWVEEGHASQPVLGRNTLRHIDAPATKINSTEYHKVLNDNGDEIIKYYDGTPTTAKQGGLRRTMCVAYSRTLLNQTGDGHVSPIGGYHAESDSVLIFDVARFKYPPYWITVEQLYKSMLAVDSISGKSRGFSFLSVKDQNNNGVSNNQDDEHRKGKLRTTSVDNSNPSKPSSGFAPPSPTLQTSMIGQVQSNQTTTPQPEQAQPRKPQCDSKEDCGDLQFINPALLLKRQQIRDAKRAQLEAKYKNKHQPITTPRYFSLADFPNGLYGVDFEAETDQSSDGSMEVGDRAQQQHQQQQQQQSLQSRKQQQQQSHSHSESEAYEYYLPDNFEQLHPLQQLTIHKQIQQHIQDRAQEKQQKGQQIQQHAHRIQQSHDEHRRQQHYQQQQQQLDYQDMIAREFLSPAEYNQYLHQKQQRQQTNNHKQQQHHHQQNEPQSRRSDVVDFDISPHDIYYQLLNGQNEHPRQHSTNQLSPHVQLRQIQRPQQPSRNQVYRSPFDGWFF